MTKKYNIIYADPPWSYNDKSLHGGGAELHYTTTKTSDLEWLGVDTIAADDCALFIWATMPMLPDALKLIDAWGFKYKTNAFTWIKKNKKADSLFYGLGRWTRGNAELCLLTTKGKPKRIAADVFSVIQTPIERHSKKPDIVRDEIVRLMGDLPRIELFAREAAPGWDHWGNELDTDIIL